jgi:UDP-glucose 4-epimerase
MSKVFITGVAGFLGSHLADRMIKAGHLVIGTDNLIGGYYDNVPKEVVFYQDDCRNFGLMNDIIKKHQPDIVYHCAATAYEGLSVFSPSLVSDNIIGASTSVFSAACANKVNRIVHCSSMARYGEITPPFKENMTPRPQDPYGIAKVAAEEMLKNLCAVHGVDYVIAVPHNIYGPRQKYDDPYRNVASIMMNMVLQHRAPIIYGDGSQQRCFSYIDDCLDCLEQMAFASNVLGQTINIGPDEQPVTINELAHVIQDVCGTEFVPQYVKGRPQEVRVALCSSDKVRRLLGYQTQVSLKHGLVHMKEWMVKRGTKKFEYHLPLEIVSAKTPATWKDRLF